MRTVTRTSSRARLLAGVLAAALPGAFLALPPDASAEPTPAGGAAPGAPGDRATWTTGAKQGFGTSTTLGSKVWFTLADGVMTELYYPRVDVADSRALELVVTDGRTFTDRETTDMRHEVELADDRALLYRQVNTDEDGRYRLRKTYVTDPDRSSVAVDVELTSLDGGSYRVYAVYDPALANSGRHDTARTVGGALVATDTTGEQPVASAVVADRPFRATSNGFAGVTDGWTDLAADHDLDARYASAVDGNVVQTAELNLERKGRTSLGTLVVGFGEQPGQAVHAARTTARRSFSSLRRAYAHGWHRYLRSLDAAPASVRGDRSLATQYAVAAMTLRAHEDKTYRGANIASLTVPWGEAQNADEAGVGGYHLVWARDLYQVATAQLAAGDEAAANRSVDYLFEVQQKPDGSFPQNTLLDGTPYWGSLQLDEVALPIVLAWQLGRTEPDLWRDHVKKAADFLVARGPSTPQERWEEEGGYSPSTIAAEIAGLVAAADIARTNGDRASAALYTGVADEWQRQVKRWTFTTTGPLGDGRYFLRISDDADPDDGAMLDINNGGGVHDERAIVDAGFLDLVRLGVLPADDPEVVASLPEIDSTIRVRTPHGDMWYRYNHDGYGEKADGAPYDGTGVGRLWPLLSGERGEYALARGQRADSYLRTMAASANEGYLIPEQVWDRAEPTTYGFRFGEGTGSATPLAWSMAQFIRLAESIDAGRPVETPSVVQQRYAGGQAPAGPALALTSPAEGASTSEPTVTVSGTSTAPQVYVHVDGTTLEVPVEGGAFSTELPVGLGTTTVTVVAEGADGGTTTVQRTITSTSFGEEVGTVADPTGDDHGPGSYVYPTDGAFNAGAFDVTGFGVYDDGRSYNLVTTIAGELRNPWGGNQLSVQRLDLYVRGASGAGSPVDALPGTNAQLAAPYDLVVTGSGFRSPMVRDASGAEVATASLLALPATRQVVFSVPKEAFGSIDPAGAQVALVMASHAGDDEGVGGIRPVYDRAYWESTAGTDMSWINQYRFGGGAGTWTGDNAAKDTDTRDPNVLDVLVPTGSSQGTVLDWRAGSPVVLPYVGLQ